MRARNVGELGLRVDVVPFSGLDERAHEGGAFGFLLRAGEIARIFRQEPDRAALARLRCW